MTEKKNFQILIIYVPKGLWLQIYGCVYFIILQIFYLDSFYNYKHMKHEFCFVYSRLGEE